MRRGPTRVPVTANNVPLSWVEQGEKSHRVLLMAHVLFIFSPASVLEGTWLGQRQHQVTLEVRKPWGHLLHGVRWNRQAELPMGLQLLVPNMSWEGSQKCAQLRWHSLCSGHSNAENQIPPVSCHPSAFGNLDCRASSLSPHLHRDPFS